MAEENSSVGAGRGASASVEGGRRQPTGYISSQNVADPKGSYQRSGRREREGDTASQIDAVSIGSRGNITGLSPNRLGAFADPATNRT